MIMSWLHCRGTQQILGRTRAYRNQKKTFAPEVQDGVHHPFRSMKHISNHDTEAAIGGGGEDEGEGVRAIVRLN
jgi:hypothetical protein